MIRLTPHQLIDRTRIVDVDDVKLWAGNPNSADVGAISRSLARFGQLDVLVICDGVVISGNHRVLAERQAPQFGGKLAALDITGLGWEPEEVTAAALALNRTARLGHDDPDLLLAALRPIAELGDIDLFEATGFDVDDLNRLVAEVKALDSPLDLSGATWWRVTVTCRDRADVDRLLDHLTVLGYDRAKVET